MIINSKFGAVAAGFVPKDAQFKQVGQYGTDHCTFSVKAYEDAPAPGESHGMPHWLNIVCWREAARYASSIVKGDHVIVCGSIQKRSYTDKNGEEKIATELVADYVHIMPDIGETFPEPTGPEAFEALDDDDDVPF